MLAPMSLAVLSWEWRILDYYYSGTIDNGDGEK
jgi:hypothetical protein